MSLDEEEFWRAYVKEFGPLSPYLREEILMKLVHSVAQPKDPEDQSGKRILKFWKLLPWLKPEDEEEDDEELTPMNVFRKLGGKKK